MDTNKKLTMLEKYLKRHFKQDAYEYALRFIKASTLEREAMITYLETDQVHSWLPSFDGAPKDHQVKYVQLLRDIDSFARNLSKVKPNGKKDNRLH